MEKDAPPAAPNQMDQPLTPEEVRVLGCLIEKSFTTPDVYPMTINALVTACNQKTSRYPVVQYDEDTVRRALDRLRDNGWAILVRTAGARTLKYKHQARRQFEFSDQELAVLCVLLLRGPQTSGELRSRCERIVLFDSVAAVEETLRELATEFPQPMVCELPRQPGQKDIRFAHLLAGEPLIPPPSLEPAPARSVAPPDSGRVDALEEEVGRLRAELERLNEQFDIFRRQFE